MPRGPCTFKKTDLTRAIAAVVAAGLAVRSVELKENGSLVLVTDKMADAADAGVEHRLSGAPNTWDRVLRYADEIP
jgi:hypothetical protein